MKHSGLMNLTSTEEKALKQLVNNNNIVIRPADKGSGIVVINKEDYVQKLREEVEGDRSYVETETDKTTESMKEIKKIVNRMCRQGDISQEMKQYLIPRYPEAGKLKGNPKLHKEGVPYRTIVNGIGTTTERLAEIAEKELNKFVISSPSYLRDTTDFLIHLEGLSRPLPEGAILFCFDVVKLYPSIPTEEGLKACEEGLNARTLKSIPTGSVMQMIELVLKNNNFKFAGKSYRQVEGVAIGSRLGKNFACAYMRKWDEKLLSFNTTSYFYKRFVDDGFGIWTDGLDSLKAFTANSIHKNIKVKLRWSSDKIEFLDTMVHVNNGELWTDLYCKPTDKHQYLQAKSCHPAATKKAIPYGLGIRLKRICSKEEDYLWNRRELKFQLRKRGYSGRFIENQLKKVDQQKREDLVKYRENRPKKNDRVPLVFTYSNLLPNVTAIVQKHMKVLYQSEEMKTVFREPPLVAFRRGANLEDILVHRKLNRVLRDPEQKCTGPCRICPILRTAPICDTMGEKSYPGYHTQTCKIRNVVYCLSCKKCEKPVYVGETERQLKERIEEHLADIRLDRQRAVGVHYNGKGHSVQDMEVLILEKIYDTSRQFRQMREMSWMRKLQTQQPLGLNTKTQCEGDWTACLI